MSLDPALAAHAVAAAGDAIVTLDHSAKVTSWNRAAEELLGFTREQAMEKGLALIIPAEYRARHVAAFHAAMDGGHLAHGGAVARVEAVTPSGGRRVLGLSLGLLAAENGQPSGVVGVLRPLGDAAVEFVTSGEGRMTQARKWVAVDFGGPEVLRMIDADVPDPGPGEVRIDVRASGMNPADAKHIAPGQDPKLLPLSIGYEVAGVVSALGPDTQLASGGGAVGDRVVAATVNGGYATAITVPASSVFAMPRSLTFAEAANLLLVGTTAADLLNASAARPGETVLLHGAAGAVGVSVLQQARQLGLRVIGTASPANFDFVRRFGGIPVEYGPGLLDRVRDAAPEGIAAALDTVGSDEAGDVSLALVADRKRIVTIAAAPRAKADGYVFVGASNPESGPFRAKARTRILKLAQNGDLVVPMAQRFGFADAPAALAALTSPHPPGKLALVNES
jgi:NADPH:quinone reductase